MNDDKNLRDSHIEAILTCNNLYAQDGLISMHNHEFMEQETFKSAYMRGIKAAKRDYCWHWRVHVGLWASSVAAKIEGDFVECGVNAGFMSSSIMHFLDWNCLCKTFYLLDTFAGIDSRYVSNDEVSDGILTKNEKLVQSGFYINDISTVTQNFSEWSRVEIIQGSIPETLDRVKTDKIAYLHIDLNCAPPEVATLKFFWDKLSSGAIVLLDDYAYYGYHHQKKAIDALAVELQCSILSLPTGQGIIIRS
jgi:hypothetical protein